MVVFTCNHCGDSIQKPRAMKHISVECKKKYAGVSLCCVDCLKDFDFNTYADHTKCFTELERYSGSNFVPKPSSNKGEKKQNSWIDTVRSVLSQSTLSNQQRQILQTISHFENVPRKKTKFQNFIKSSIRNIRIFPDVVDSVFDLIEKEFKNSAISTPIDSNTNSVSNKHDEIKIDSNAKGDIKNIQDGNDILEFVCSEEQYEQKITNKPQKEITKSNINKTNSSTTDATEEKSTLNEVLQKKKKNKSENGSETSEKGENVLVEDEKSDTKHKKKKRKQTPDIQLDKDENNSFKKKKKLKETRNDHSNEKMVDLLSCSVNENHCSIQNGNEKSKLVINEKKVMKKQKKKVTYTDEIRLIINSDTAMETQTKDDEVVLKIEKKKRNNGCATENEKNSISNDEKSVDDEQMLTKRKKIKRKSETQFDVDENNDTNCDSSVGNQIKKKKKLVETGNNDLYQNKIETVSGNENQTLENNENGIVKFNWEEVVTSILSKSTNNEMTVKKMKKKVVKEYRKFSQNSKPFENIVKKIDKKVKKMTNVVIEKERIRLRA